MDIIDYSLVRRISRQIEGLSNRLGEQQTSHSGSTDSSAFKYAETLMMHVNEKEVLNVAIDRLTAQREEFVAHITNLEALVNKLKVDVAKSKQDLRALAEKHGLSESMLQKYRERHHSDIARLHTADDLNFRLDQHRGIVEKGVSSLISAIKHLADKYQDNPELRKLADEVSLSDLIDYAQKEALKRLGEHKAEKEKAKELTKSAP